MQGLTRGEYHFEADAGAVAFNWYKSCIKGVKLPWCVKWQLCWREDNSPGSQKAGEDAASVLPGEIAPADPAQPRGAPGAGDNPQPWCRKASDPEPGACTPTLRGARGPAGAGSPRDGV